MNFLRRLLCFHPYWVKTGPMDWRIDLCIWTCTRCGKKKNFGYVGIPINYVEP
jgi:hypothetical protein